MGLQNFWVYRSMVFTDDRSFFFVWAYLGSSARKRVEPCEPKTCAMYKQQSKETKQNTTKQDACRFTPSHGK